MQCVASASSNKAVMAALETHAPNAFVLDLSLDDGSSLPLITQLRERLPGAAIVVYTGHKNTLLEQHCLQAGADAMIVKGGEIEELTAALRGAAQRSARRQARHPHGEQGRDRRVGAHRSLGLARRALPRALSIEQIFQFV